MSISSLVALMIVHVVSDWLLQDRETAKNKSHNFKYLFPHLFIIHIGLMIWGFFFAGFNHKQTFIFSIANCTLHGIIDWNIWKVYAITVRKRFEHLELFTYYDDGWFYNFIALDQLLHGLCYIGLYVLIQGRFA
jgi:hypothetical protein